MLALSCHDTDRRSFGGAIEGIVKVDVREDPETSRTFNIRATPTLVLMKDNVVTQVALGAKTESQMETMLKKLA
ncbi:MAG: thioredoxin domain-containing protein [Candidatus Thiodiazotropha endolucinida]